MAPETFGDPEYRTDVLTALQGYFGVNWNITKSLGKEWGVLKVVLRGVRLGKTYSIRRNLERELTLQGDALAQLQSRGGDCVTEDAGHLEACGWVEVISNRLDCYVRKNY
ncbi:hypothetical protein NDU88_001761 [Pleurodeles waltl]|uniref:Uncharacterized protein n=1 Tax=Pleurodeles waltl TaxID=8319 RepID=A0AAV7S9V6_PLEWA|nr:hypothetical protein NDU88_001761 [Pleurodeles waltl]